MPYFRAFSTRLRKIEVIASGSPTTWWPAGFRRRRHPRHLDRRREFAEDPVDDFVEIADGVPQFQITPLEPGEGEEILGEACEFAVLAQGEVEIVSPLLPIGENESVRIINEGLEEDAHRGERGLHLVRDGGEEVAAEIIDLQSPVHREPHDRGDEGDAEGPGARARPGVSLGIADVVGQIDDPVEEDSPVAVDPLLNHHLYIFIRRNLAVVPGLSRRGIVKLQNRSFTEDAPQLLEEDFAVGWRRGLRRNAGDEMKQLFAVDPRLLPDGIVALAEGVVDGETHRDDGREEGQEGKQHDEPADLTAVQPHTAALHDAKSNKTR